MSVSQEFFSKEKTLPRLIDWFNNLPAGQRTVAPGEMFIIRVKAIENEHGEPIFLIQQTTSDIPGGYNYMGESVFLWIGETGENLVATDSSFFELSRQVQTTINVRPMNGRLTLPTPGPSEAPQGSPFYLLSGVSNQQDMDGARIFTAVHPVSADGTVDAGTTLPIGCYSIFIGNNTVISEMFVTSSHEILLGLRGITTDSPLQDTVDITVASRLAWSSIDCVGKWSHQEQQWTIVVLETGQMGGDMPTENHLHVVKVGVNGEVATTKFFDMGRNDIDWTGVGEVNPERLGSLSPDARVMAVPTQISRYGSSTTTGYMFVSTENDSPPTAAPSTNWQAFAWIPNQAVDPDTLLFFAVDNNYELVLGHFSVSEAKVTDMPPLNSTVELSPGNSTIQLYVSLDASRLAVLEYGCAGRLHSLDIIASNGDIGVQYIDGSYAHAANTRCISHDGNHYFGQLGWGDTDIGTLNLKVPGFAEDPVWLNQDMFYFGSIEPIYLSGEILDFDIFECPINEW